MPAFGAQDILFGKFKTEETSAALPTYEAPVSLGPLMTANMTITAATADIYGDNKQQAKVEEFVSAAIPAEVTECPKEAIALVYGADYNASKKEIGYSTEDAPPYGGLSYIKNLMDGSGKKFYEAHFFPKAKAARGNENAQTKGSSVSFQSATLNFTVTPPLLTGSKWEHVAEFDNLEDAKAWVNEKYGAATPAP